MKTHRKQKTEKNLSCFLTVAFCFKECKDKAGNGCESCFEKRIADGFWDAGDSSFLLDKKSFVLFGENVYQSAKGVGMLW